MTQHQLDRAVARATGETVETIQRRGFSLVSPARPQQRSCRPRRRPARPFTPLKSKGGHA